MRRRYKVTGTQGVQNPETGEVVGPGRVFAAESDQWIDGQVAIGVLTLEADAEQADPPTMPCPLCEEQGKKKVPKFADQGELEEHYKERHAGFVVPAFDPREAVE